MDVLSVNFLLFKGENYVYKSVNKIKPESLGKMKYIPMEHQFLHLIIVPLF
jgi:hypothetical protein